MADTGPRRRLRFVPRALAASMEAESREWLVRCSVCGYERSVWECGGVRWKASGRSRQYRRCPNCGTPNWHTIYRPRDGGPLPPIGSILPDGTLLPPPGGRPRRPTWQYIVPSVLVLVLLVASFVGGLFFVLNRVSATPRAATAAYVHAVGADDWDAAVSDLSAAQRRTQTSATQAETWGARERGHGPPAGFRTTSYSIKSRTARISGVLTYRDGTTAGATVYLVREGSDWKIDDVRRPRVSPLGICQPAPAATPVAVSFVTRGRRARAAPRVAPPRRGRWRSIAAAPFRRAARGEDSGRSPPPRARMSPAWRTR
jgi:hypothetical protein